MRCSGGLWDVCVTRWVASGGKRAAAPACPRRDARRGAAARRSPAPCPRAWWVPPSPPSVPRAPRGCQPVPWEPGRHAALPPTKPHPRCPRGGDAPQSHRSLAWTPSMSPQLHPAEHGLGHPKRPGKANLSPPAPLASPPALSPLLAATFSALTANSPVQENMRPWKSKPVPSNRATFLLLLLLSPFVSQPTGRSAPGLRCVPPQPGCPPPRTQSPPSRRELVSGLAEGFGEQAGRQARRCRQSPRAFPLRPSLRCSKPPARVGTAAPGSVTSPAGLGDTRGRGSSGVSPRRPRCAEQSWESPFLHRTGQRTQHCSSPDQGRVPPSPFGPVLKQIRSLLLPVFPPQPPRPPWLEPPGLPSTAPSVGPSTTGGSSPGQRRRGREECVGSGAQTSQENPLQSDLPFPKSREQEAWEHQGAPSSLPVLGMARVAPLCGRGTDPWPSGVLGWGAAPQTTATPAQSTLCHRCPPPWSPSADSKQPLVQLQPQHGRARTGARKG